MDKPRILIWMTSMHPGGAERALIGLLHAFDYSRVQVDLFLNRHEGDFMSDIPKEVNLMPENPKYKSIAEPIQLTIKQGHLIIAASRLLGKIATKRKVAGDRLNSGIAVEYSHKYTKWLMPRINSDVEYDLAISFITPHYFVSEKIKAKKKIAWIHTDYSQISIDRRSQEKMWGPYNKIIAVSESVKESFCQVFPSLKGKVEVIENILPETLIKAQAEEKVDDFVDGSEIRLLSIGRFSFPKNFDNIPEICSYLHKKGLPVKWYIIGYGGGEESIRKNILDARMEENVIILGKRSNPYPYIKACDLYVQPSRYEGKAVTVREAQMLGRPVVITDFPTAKSQLDDGVDGLIVPLENEGCAEGISRVLKNTEQMEAIQRNCIIRDYSNKTEVQKIYSLIDG